MDEINKKWKKYANKRRKDFLEKVIGENTPVSDSEAPLAIIMAGGPGSGKSELRSLILELDIELCIIDPDDFRSQMPDYNGRNASDYQSATSILTDYCFDRIVEQHYSLLLDTTFASKNAAKKIKGLIKEGYCISIYYVYEDPDIAWNFVKRRERVVPRQAFEESTRRAYDNICDVWNKFDFKTNTSHIILCDRYNQIMKVCSSKEDLFEIKRIIDKV